MTRDQYEHDEAPATQQAIAPHVNCDIVADEIELIERWWRSVGQRGLSEDCDVLGLCLRALRARAYEAAQLVRALEDTSTALMEQWRPK